jgi:hypothetical protein
MIAGTPGVFWDAFKEMAKDPDGIGVWFTSQKNVGTGLKMVPFRGEDGRAILPSDEEAVRSGRYPLRIAATFLVHPDANQATKDFARWVLTQEAAKAIAEARRNETIWPMPTYPAFIHVSPTPTVKGNAAERRAISAPVAPPEVKFDSKIEGAVAVMPTQRLSVYNLMIDHAHQAAYEQFLFEALTTNGRLKLIDRSQLTKLLQERELLLKHSPQAVPPLIAADVFVFSSIVSNKGQVTLHLQAVHAPTASLLSEIELPINAGDPLHFTPPLSVSVARWWPGVLRGLADARSKPIWSVLDVYGGKLEWEETADDLRRSLDDTLAAEPKVFHATFAPLGDTRQESLLWRMGLIQSRMGRNCPGCDYLVDARLTGPHELELRLRGTDLSILARTMLNNSDRTRLLGAAKVWLQGQIIAKSSRSPRERKPISLADDDWARQQARMEYDIACRLRDKALALNPRPWSRDMMETWHWTVLTNPEARQWLTDARRHNRRAAQLDPTWETVAHAALEPFFLYPHLLGGDNRLSSPEDRIDDDERFLAAFPNSPHHEEVLAWCILECIQIGNPRENLRPLVPIDPALQSECFRKAMQRYPEYLRRYSMNGKGGGMKAGASLGFIFFFHNLHDFVHYLKPSDDELKAIVDQWTKDFDAHCDKAPHSDFVRLQIMHAKNDKAGYVKLLTKLQARWPNPKQAEWQTGGLNSVLQSWMYLFPGPVDKDPLWQWSRGKRGPGDLQDVYSSPKK